MEDRILARLAVVSQTVKLKITAFSRRFDDAMLRSSWMFCGHTADDFDSYKQITCTATATGVAKAVRLSTS